MSVSDISGIQVPPGIAVWVDRLVYLFLGLFVLWVVLKVIGFALRRSYNLTPVATASSKDIRPDFLKVDRAAQKEMIERGREFDRRVPAGLGKAVSATSFGMLASGAITFVSAAFLAFGRVEEFDATWRKLSTTDRFFAIIETHPFGFAVALAMILAALARLVMSLRRPR